MTAKGNQVTSKKNGYRTTPGAEVSQVVKDATPIKTSTTVYGSVDTGWAWVIMMALALWNTLMAGTLKSFGILYLEYLDLYNRGPVATAWMGFSFSFLTTVIAPVSGYIGDHVTLGSQRKLVMIVGVAIAVTVAATGWMSTLEGAILTYGLAGIGAAIIDTPILGLLGKYFRERRFLASGVVFAGSSFGTLVLPPLLTLLVDAYAIRGAMVVFGGVWLHTLIIGAVIRPVAASSTNARGVDIKDTSDDDDDEAELGMHPEDRYLRCVQHSDADMKRSTLSLELQPNGISMFIGSSRQNIDRQLAQRRVCELRHQSKSVPSLPRALNDDSKNVCLSANNINIGHNDKGGKDTRPMLNNNVQVNEKGGETSLSEDTTVCDECDPEPLSLSKKLCRVVHDYWIFLKTPGLPMLIVTFCTASFAYFNQFFVFPPFAQELGMSKLQGALLVSICNSTELVARLVVGMLVDRGHLKKPTLIKISFILSAMAGFAVSFFRNKILLFVYSGIFGLVGGVFVPLSIPLMVELVPESQVASAAGVFVLVTGTGISLGPPILGAVKALTNSFADSLRLCSIFYLVSLMLYVIHCGDLKKCIGRRKKERHIIISEHDLP